MIALSWLSVPESASGKPERRSHNNPWRHRLKHGLPTNVADDPCFGLSDVLDQAGGKINLRAESTATSYRTREAQIPFAKAACLKQLTAGKKHISSVQQSSTGMVSIGWWPRQAFS
jgi:hypothetical protein